MARVFYLCGPSGAGKNAVMAQALQHDPSLRLARRTVTRPSDPSEQVETLSESAFQAAVAENVFVWWWSANGLHYGIRHAEIQGDGVVLVNGSRAYWPEASQRMPSALLIVLQVDPTVLADRLIHRGRESRAAIEARLDRNAQLQSDALITDAWLVLDNTHALADVAKTLVEAIRC